MRFNLAHVGFLWAKLHHFKGFQKWAKRGQFFPYLKYTIQLWTGWIPAGNLKLNEPRSNYYPAYSRDQVFKDHETRDDWGYTSLLGVTDEDLHKLGVPNWWVHKLRIKLYKMTHHFCKHIAGARL